MTDWRAEDAQRGVDLGDQHYVHRLCVDADGATRGHPAGELPPGAILIGLLVTHLNGEPDCPGGWVGFDNVAAADPRARHQLVSANPLTVEPSLLCPCGDHGYIINGAWQAC